MEASAVTNHSMVPQVLKNGNYETWSSFMEDYVTNHSMVPQVLKNGNYETWSSFMEDYLSGQDLWDVVTQDANTVIATSGAESWFKIANSWGRNNDLALLAIQMSCGPKFFDLVAELRSSKEAWDRLASASNSQPKDEEDEGSQGVEDETEYGLFIEAINQGDPRLMEMFIYYHPEALSALMSQGGPTALHYAISCKKKEMAMWLVERMTADDLEILDGRGYTAITWAVENCPSDLDLMELMIKKNPRLLNIGVIAAFIQQREDSARLLYRVTDKSVLSPQCGEKGVHLLNLCIQGEIYDIAAELIQLFPDILLHPDLKEGGPIELVAKTCHYFSRQGEDQHPRYENPNGRKQINNHYHDFVISVCKAVSTFNHDQLNKSVYPAVMDAAKHGNAKFIDEMIKANPLSLDARDDQRKSMFRNAIENRQEKVFSLINKFDLILLEDVDDDKGNNMLHLAAMLPARDVLGRISSSPVLQLQREVLWFKEAWSLADPSLKKARNKDGLTPRQLFSRSHAGMIAEGEKLIKETDTSSTVVGALIVTIMFAAAFTAPGGNDQETGYPVFANKILFNLFIICDVLSLSSSATSILVFLTILANSYAGEDFLFDLPKRLMMGVATLFFSIATMMITFCLALALMLNGRLQLILPIALITSAPVILFSKSMFPLVSKIFHSTFGSSIFHRKNKRLMPWDLIASVIVSIRKKAALKAMNYGMRAMREEMDSMV